MSLNPTELLKVALYARVSTEEQREGQTIDSQIAELERFARERGWQITGTYKDEGWSGSLLARPELDRLRDDASKKLFGIVLVNDVDRLARDVTHLGIVKRDLEKCGTQVVFRKLPAEKSPTYNLMVNILGSFAEFEREMIIDRTRRGRRHKVEVRQQFLGSNAPFGYRYVQKDKASGKEGYLELIPEEAAAVRQMFAWVDKESLSARKVVERLTEMQIRPRKGGDHWAKSSVLRILRTETYVGVWHYNKFEGCEPKKPSRTGKYRRAFKSSLRRRDKSEWIPVVLPDNLKIIERDQWERVQRQLDVNITFSPRNTKHEYLLKGLVKCGGCGARYVGDPNHGTYYYRCFARCKKLPALRETVLDNTVWEAVKEAMLNPTIVLDQLAAMYGHRKKDAHRQDTEQQEIEVMLIGLDKEEERILEAYRMNILSPEQLGREMEKLSARRVPLEAKKARLTEKAQTVEFPAIKRSLADYCKIAAQRLISFSNEERKQFLRLLIDEIVYEGSQVRIRGVIPISRLSSQEESASVSGLREEHSGDGGEAVEKQQDYEGFKSYRITDMAMNSRDRNSVYEKGRIADMEAYSRDRNPVDEIPFELAKSLPATRIPLRDMFSRDTLRSLVARNPHSTLSQLCELVRLEQGTVLSTTSMCRLLKQYGILHNEKSRVEADNMLMPLAA
jgi:site-specific DNA recombinase